MLRPVRIRNYISILAPLGISAAHILRGSGLDESALNEPDCLVSPAQVQMVITNILELRGGTGIGLDLGARTDLMMLGMVGYALASSRSRRDTLAVWSRFAEPLLGIMTKIAATEDNDGNLILTVVVPVHDAAVEVFCIEEMLSMNYFLGQAEAGGVAPKILSITLPYPEPVYGHRYQELFGCPVHFGAAKAQIVVCKDGLDSPLPTNDEEFNSVCQQHCSRVLNKISNTSPFATRIRDSLLRSPDIIPTLEDVADEYGVTPRTLRRYLHNEGFNYQTLVKGFRADLAREYLMAGDLPVKRIADQLGFEDVSSFRRAFKAWTGKTVNTYRASLKQEH